MARKRPAGLLSVFECIKAKAPLLSGLIAVGVGGLLRPSRPRLSSDYNNQPEEEMTSHGQTLLGEMIRATVNAREVIENHRPDWLNGMELDFWVPEWNLAFEFQGDQHFTPVFGLDAYAAQAVRDKLKRKICESRGVMLIAFEAASLEPFRMSCKLQYHIARLNPDMKKGERKKLLRQMLNPRWATKKQRKHLLKEKYAYCRKLKASFGSHTAFKKGSNARHEAKTAQWQGIPWWEVAQARQVAQARYLTKPPLPRIGMGMSRAQRFTPPS